jgi:hypothetical protein
VPLRGSLPDLKGFKPLPPPAPLRIVRIQDFERRGGCCDVWRRLVLRNDALTRQNFIRRVGGAAKMRVGLTS